MNNNVFVCVVWFCLCVCCIVCRCERVYVTKCVFFRSVIYLFVCLCLATYLAVYKTEAKTQHSNIQNNIYGLLFGKSLVTLAHVSKHTLRLDILYYIQLFFARQRCFCISRSFNQLVFTLFLSFSLSMLICFQTLSLICSQRTRRLFCFVSFFLLHFQLAFCKFIAFSFVVFVESAGKEKRVH